MLRHFDGEAFISLVRFRGLHSAFRDLPSTLFGAQILTAPAVIIDRVGWGWSKNRQAKLARDVIQTALPLPRYYFWEGDVSQPVKSSFVSNEQVSFFKVICLETRIRQMLAGQSDYLSKRTANARLLATFSDPEQYGSEYITRLKKLETGIAGF